VFGALERGCKAEKSSIRFRPWPIDAIPGAFRALPTLSPS